MVDPVATTSRAPGRATALGYALSVLGYAGLGFWNQDVLSFSNALVYFVLTLEGIPRLYRFVRYGAHRPPFRPGAARAER